MDQAPQGLISVTEILGYLSQDRYLSLSEVIAYVNLSERTIRERLAEIRHYRVGSKLLFKKSDVDCWMERHLEAGAGLDLDHLADEALKGILGSVK